MDELQFFRHKSGVSDNCLAVYMYRPLSDDALCYGPRDWDYDDSEIVDGLVSREALEICFEEVTLAQVRVSHPALYDFVKNRYG